MSDLLRSSRRYRLWLVFLLCVQALAAPASAEGDEAFASALAGLGSSSRTRMIEAVEQLAALGDDRALPALEALADRRLRVGPDGALYSLTSLVGGGEVVKRIPSLEIVSEPPPGLRKAKVNNRVKRAARGAIARLQLRASDPAVRLAAATKMRTQPSVESAELIRAALAEETHANIAEALRVALAQLQLESESVELRLAAAETLGEFGDVGLAPQLRDRLQVDSEGHRPETDSQVVRALEASLAAIERRASWIEFGANLFYGTSLASILCLAALGLAITFGLMGVINMAHGEMVMLGAYATYVVQNLFLEYAPAHFDVYPLAAIPVAFMVVGAIGMAMERSVIRHLYGRPLETLLATWGISLLLIQSVRLIFGAQNVEVANPEWLSGGIEVAYGVVLPRSRIAIIAFAVIVVSAITFVLQRTSLGLRVRAVTQNRAMAGALGVSTHRVDMWTFGLGCAIAGLGGVALSQIGNVGPELGRGYIVDSFLVVVVGGVGKIVGTVWAAFGLGLLNKFLEPAVGAVFGKILVLVFIILFIQRRPQGLFAQRGRAAEA
ncbi:MAG: urea ABC transporter permease subunit UrtB [Myxococcota bacterium]